MASANKPRIGKEDGHYAFSKVRVSQYIDRDSNKNLCLGGAFAAMAAARLQEEGIEVKLYIIRSFKRFDQTVIDLVMPRKYDTWPIIF